LLSTQQFIATRRMGLDDGNQTVSSGVAALRSVTPPPEFSDYDVNASDHPPPFHAENHHSIASDASTPHHPAENYYYPPVGEVNIPNLGPLTAHVQSPSSSHSCANPI
jgi:hypothetical protein